MPILTAALLVACGAGTPPSAACNNPVLVEETFPPPGTTDVFFRAPFEVRLTEPDNAATLTLRDLEGTVWPGRVLARGPTLRFEPTQGLEPLSDYELVVSRSGCVDENLPFRTGRLGGPLAIDPSGRRYRLDVEGAEWLEPVGLIDSARGFFRFVEILLEPTIDQDGITILGAQGDLAGAQDLCLPTFAFEGVLFDDPYLEVVADVVPFEVVGLRASVFDARLTGAFDPEGESMMLSVSGRIRVDPFIALSDWVDTAEEACLEIEILGGECVPCPNGELACVPLIIQDALAERVEAPPLVEVGPEAPCP